LFEIKASKKIPYEKTSDSFLRQFVHIILTIQRHVKAQSMAVAFFEQQKQSITNENDSTKN
jgi:hypothetical protein